MQSHPRTSVHLPTDRPKLPSNGHAGHRRVGREWRTSVFPTGPCYWGRVSEVGYTSAVNGSALCRQRGIDRVLLATDVIHMQRAAGAFHAQCLVVSPVPADVWAPH